MTKRKSASNNNSPFSELVVVSSKQRHLHRPHNVVNVGRSDDVDRFDVLERSAANFEHDDAGIAHWTIPLLFK
jgi:hypothetical protein